MALLGVLAAKKAAELRVRAEDARRRATASSDAIQRAAHLRRHEDFEKRAARVEQPERT